MGIFILPFIFLFSQIIGIEFFYSLQRKDERCFEDQLPGNTLMNGDIFFTMKGSITLEIKNSFDENIYSKV